jgi:hypothetical protein
MKMQQQQHDNTSKDEPAGTGNIVNFQPKQPCSVRIKKSSSFRIRGIPHNWTSSSASTTTTSVCASSAASTVSIDSISSLLRIGHGRDSPTKTKPSKQGDKTFRAISPLRKLFHLGGSNKDHNLNSSNSATSNINNIVIETCDRTCSEASSSPKPERHNILNEESIQDEKLEGCAEQPMDFTHFTLPGPLHMQQQHEIDDELSLEKDSPQVGILSKISEEVSVSMESIEISKNEVLNKKLGTCTERMPDTSDKKLELNVSFQFSKTS